MDLSPTTLEGAHVRLEPLGHHHTTALFEVAIDADLWRYTPTRIASRDDLSRFIETALEWQQAGTALAFATVDRATGRAVGSTRFAMADHGNRHVEIGWTWLGRDFQRTALNTEAKLLMLAHAFERLGCLRVELKTDVLNQKSRTAILRLRATEEGVFRHHIVMPDGRLRDTVYYSILSPEWPAVRVGLEARLAAHR
jgi:RimJ/RimL family protein N-acetyltransferase